LTDHGHVREGRNRALDGMRAFAVLAVMAGHLTYFDPGISDYPKGFDLGVDVFFVLSGFLITSLLLKERSETGKVALGAFYMRRALRLFPALAVVIVAAVLVAVTFGPAAFKNPTIDGVPWVILYVGNWARATGGPNALGLLGHTWSLAIEEQFYLIWPAIFLLFRRVKHRHMAIALVLVAVIEMAWRLLLLRHNVYVNRVYMGTDTHTDGLLLGCALAFWDRRDNPRPLEGRRRVALQAVGLAATVGLVAMVVDYGVSAPTMSRALSAAAVLMTLVLWSAIEAPVAPIIAALSWRPVVWIGRRSYGLYLWHYVLFAGSTGWGANKWAKAALLIAAAFVAAALSYRLVEQPFLRRKVRFQRAALQPA
jgi:peptidoglycan/LPS O-acetylase OafA/YrhL